LTHEIQRILAEQLFVLLYQETATLSEVSIFASNLPLAVATPFSFLAALSHLKSGSTLVTRKSTSFLDPKYPYLKANYYNIIHSKITRICTPLIN
jgi:hypothetical protein